MSDLCRAWRPVSREQFGRARVMCTRTRHEPDSPHNWRDWFWFGTGEITRNWRCAGRARVGARAQAVGEPCRSELGQTSIGAARAAGWRVSVVGGHVDAMCPSCGASQRYG